MERWIWGFFVAACLIWYSTITIYVAIRGAWDIRAMLRRLAAGEEQPG